MVVYKKHQFILMVVSCLVLFCAGVTTSYSDTGITIEDVRVGSDTDFTESFIEKHEATGHLFIVGKRNEHWSVFISTDNGQSWTNLYTFDATVDISTAISGDYLYVGYVKVLPVYEADKARLVRFSTSNGNFDAVFSEKIVFDKNIDIREISLDSDANDKDLQLYYTAILANDNLTYHYASVSNPETWSEINTGVTDALYGLDTTNHLYWGGTNYPYYFSASYISSATDNPVKIAILNGLDNHFRVSIIAPEYTGLLNPEYSTTSIAAYQNKLICVYEYMAPGMVNGGIEVRTSDDGGVTWTSEIIEESANINQYYMPVVAIGASNGVSVFYNEYTPSGSTNAIRTRKNFLIGGLWSAPLRINDPVNAPSVKSHLALSWLPPLVNSIPQYAYNYITSTGKLYFNTVNDTIVSFPDNNLKECVYDALGFNSGIITASDLSALTSFECQNSSVQNISGLEYAVNLTYLRLNNNQISDITPLSNLVKLQDLLIYYNDIEDLSPLSSLIQLRDLNIFANNISDISPLSSLTNLQYLTIYRNQISDISPLSNLTNLTSLNLGINQISDIAPLSGLTSLSWLWLNENQINDISALSNLNNLIRLYISENYITDFSPVTHVSIIIGMNDQLPVTSNNIIPAILVYLIN